MELVNYKTQNMTNVLSATGDMYIWATHAYIVRMHDTESVTI